MKTVTVRLVSAIALSLAIGAMGAHVSAKKVPTPEDTLQAAFKAVLAADFEGYLKTLHPEERETRTQKDHVKRYQWKRFLKNATRYLQEKRTDSFSVVRKEVDGDSVALYLQDRTRPERMPVPVRLRKAGEVWGIVMNSL